MAGDNEQITIRFQWTVGDDRALEKRLGEMARLPSQYPLLVVSRIAALASVFAVAYFLIPGLEYWKLLVLTVAASWSIWVSSALTLTGMRAVEILHAKDPKFVGWINVLIDRRGLFWSDDTSHIYQSWLGVSDVEELDGSIWIKTGEVMGFYLPSRIFESGESADGHLKLINEFRAKPTAPIHDEAKARDNPLRVH